MKCDSCDWPVSGTDYVTVMTADRMDEYIFHLHCWEDVEKATMEWYEWHGQLFEGEPDGEDSYYMGLGDDPGYRVAMHDAGRGRLLH